MSRKSVSMRKRMRRREWIKQCWRDNSNERTDREIYQGGSDGKNEVYLETSDHHEKALDLTLRKSQRASWISDIGDKEGKECRERSGVKNSCEQLIKKQKLHLSSGCLFLRKFIEYGNGFVDLRVEVFLILEQCKKLIIIHFQKHTSDLSSQVRLRSSLKYKNIN